MRPVLLLLFCLVWAPCASAGAQSTGQHEEHPSAATARTRELARVDARLAELKLERERHSIVPPTVLMAVGFASGGALLFVAFVDSVVNDGVHDADPREEEHRIRVLAGTSLIGFAAGVGGALWLSARLRARRALLPERKGLLEYKKKLLAPELSLGVQGHTLVLRAAF